MDENFSGLKAVFINCSLKPKKEDSHTQLLLDRCAEIMEHEGVTVDHIYPLEHRIAFGMFQDGAEHDLVDDWPALQKRVLEADILVLGTPIWLGVKSSVATQVIERLYAFSGDKNSKGQYAYYGKVGGCVVTGNEDGIKHCGMEILYALQHIGYTVPPQADCGWIGEAGPGPSYGDPVEGKSGKVGYDNEFTHKNATFMTWNLMHFAKMLKANDGISSKGNTVAGWKQVKNALPPS